MNLINKIICMCFIIAIHLVKCSYLLPFNWLPFPSKETTCSIIETCKYCVDPNIKNLTEALDKHVFGQHIATKIVISSLTDHLSQPNPKKPLTMAFLGWPGIGKNYIASFIVHNIYANGFNSKFVKFYAGQIDFSEEGLVNYYKTNLYSEIKETVRKCPRSLFIFDEVDKVPSGVFDSLKSIFDFDTYLEQTDFRHAIFIFLSNAGGNTIAKKLNEYLTSGYKREDLQLYDLEHDMRIELFNEEGGLKKADVIAVDLIDHYIPFLPLEDKHVELCILNEFSMLNVPATEENIQEIKKYISFDSSNRFATSGCKRIHKKVGTIKYKLKQPKYEL